jgi:NAD(P)H-hydrate epimerase
MKILSIGQIRQADAYTIEHEPVSDLDLMERAASRLTGWLLQHVPPGRKIHIFCGTGNNGGDGFAVARMLGAKKYRVEVSFVRFSEKISDSCQANYLRLKKTRGIRLHEVSRKDDLPPVDTSNVVLDAILGSGLSKPVRGLAADAIDHINGSGAEVVAVDVPSGFFCEQSNTDNKGSVIRAQHTLTFQFPKFGFMFPENHVYTGEFEVLPIGLHPGFVQRAETRNFYVGKEECRTILKTRSKFDHKGRFGHGLLIAGSYGKMGAAVLAARAAMRSGAGLITVHIPGAGYDIIQSSSPESMVSLDEDPHVFTRAPDLTIYNALAVGPGIGTGEQTQRALKLLIQNSTVPMVFDADALNILGMNKTWLSFLPKGSILTPHPREFERIAGRVSGDFERNRLQREFAFKHQCHVILKGRHTAIACPDGNCHFNSTGNPGMATGGSGDVLTGILLGLLAQNYLPGEAAVLGVYLHGLAGDLAAATRGQESMVAGDIIEHLGMAFNHTRKDTPDI